MSGNVGPRPSHAYYKKKTQKNMEDFASDLEMAVNLSLPSIVKPYNGVFVLAIHWSNDKTGATSLEDELCQVFATTYGYTVEKYLINADLSQYDTRWHFTERLRKFVGDYNKQGNLLIVVYSGHASQMTSNGHYLLGGDVDKNSLLISPTLDWSYDIAGSITDTKADVLVILDCCYASSTAVGDKDGPEILAASTWESTAGAALDASFTQNLINELKQLDGKSSSVASIYSKIHRGVKIFKDITACPLHVAKVGRDSIILSRLHPPTNRSQTIIGPLQPKDERVVVTVHLSNDNGAMPDIQQWTAWLTSHLPSQIHKTQITIEGVFDADSIVILVAMPLEVWTALPGGDGAYGFVSFVKSGNRLMPQQPTLSLGATKENLPFRSPPKV